MLSNKLKLAFFKADLAQYRTVINDEEIKTRISSLLFKYISAEGFYKKLLAAEKEKNGVKLTDKEKRDLRVQALEVMRVLKHFGIEYDPDMIERLFGSRDNNYMDCTVKKLRDKLVHKVNGNVIRALLERYEEINSDIDSFFALFD